MNRNGHWQGVDVESPLGDLNLLAILTPSSGCSEKLLEEREWQIIYPGFAAM